MSAKASVIKTVADALQSAEHFSIPYDHWILKKLMPSELVGEIRGLDFSAPELGGVSGKRELHNDQRSYFDEMNLQRHSAMTGIANAFQSPLMVRLLQDFFKADLDQTYLRIEYALDVTGFWLQPHTDLGVKRLTILHYIADQPNQSDLGTDIFNADKSWAKRTPFEPNTALAFVPGDSTYHGFQERPINGVRKSLIINYVTDEWRDRDQLAFPDKPVSAV